MLQRQCNQTKTAVQVSYTVAAQQSGKKTLWRALNLGTRVSLQSLKELCPKRMESFTDTRIFWNQYTRVTERSKPLHYCWLTVEEITVTVQSKAWVCDPSVAELNDSNPAERMNLCIMCSFRFRPLRRADPAFRGVLPNSDRWYSSLRSFSPATHTKINCVSFLSTALQAGRSQVDSRWCNWNFCGLNPSRRTMALGSTQLLTDKRTRHISCGVKTAGA
jgi:hypothetical protein